MMHIAVVGLGLIGGSFCRAIKQKTNHAVWGMDIDEATIQAALACGAIDRAIQADDLAQADVVLVALHPRQAIDFLLHHTFGEGAVVCDLCGVKTAIIQAVDQPLAQQGVYYVGAHPMAGLEQWGFAASTPDLFAGASMIITPTGRTAPTAIDCMEQLSKAVGFGRVVLSTAEEHDRRIAFTSQLAHVVSNAYVKSPSAQQQSGFSAGSFQDLTRVAKLNEHMWAPLFLYNGQPLVEEIETLITHLTQYRDAIAAGDEATLTQLLATGRQAKERLLEQQPK